MAISLNVVGRAHEAVGGAGFTWFVYGSSLDAEAFAAWARDHGYRVPDFSAARPARLPGWRLAFDAPSRMWGGPVASLARGAGRGRGGARRPHARGGPRPRRAQGGRGLGALRGGGGDARDRGRAGPGARLPGGRGAPAARRGSSRARLPRRDAPGRPRPRPSRRPGSAGSRRCSADRPRRRSAATIPGRRSVADPRAKNPRRLRSASSEKGFSSGFTSTSAAPPEKQSCPTRMGRLVAPLVPTTSRRSAAPAARRVDSKR